MFYMQLHACIHFSKLFNLVDLIGHALNCVCKGPWQPTGRPAPSSTNTHRDIALSSQGGRFVRCAPNIPRVTSTMFEKRKDPRHCDPNHCHQNLGRHPMITAMLGSAFHCLPVAGPRPAKPKIDQTHNKHHGNVPKPNTSTICIEEKTQSKRISSAMQNDNEGRGVVGLLFPITSGQRGWPDHPHESRDDHKPNVSIEQNDGQFTPDAMGIFPGMLQVEHWVHGSGHGGKGQRGSGKRRFEGIS